MPMAERSWVDRNENYADGYTYSITASTADNIMGIDKKQPIVLYSITISLSQAVASGEVALVDGSATGDSGDTRKFRFVCASGVTTARPDRIHCDFPRGMVFDKGLIVSAATCTGALVLTYKARYE